MEGTMALHWIAYQDARGLPLGVLLMQSNTLIYARLKAAMLGLDVGGRFYASQRLPDDFVAMVRPGEIGHMLSPSEARRITDRFEGRVERPQPTRKSVRSVPKSSRFQVALSG
jgi:hypothetical protein